MAWKKLVDAYRGFRQSRHPGSRTPGRSHWPEPDAIRILARTHNVHHPPPKGASEVFPRAYYGLPIIFHFKDQDEPGDSSLEGAGHDRRASPLLLRPVVCREGSVGLALVLTPQSLPPDGLVWKGASGKQRVEAGLSPEQQKRIPPLESGGGPFKPFLKKVSEVR